MKIKSLRILSTTLLADDEESKKEKRKKRSHFDNNSHRVERISMKKFHSNHKQSLKSSLHVFIEHRCNFLNIDVVYIERLYRVIKTYK
jgi:hypothetical protein